MLSVFGFDLTAGFVTAFLPVSDLTAKECLTAVTVFELFVNLEFFIFELVLEAVFRFVLEFALEDAEFFAEAVFTSFECLAGCLEFLLSSFAP